MISRLLKQSLLQDIFCPICKMREWSFDGYHTDARYVDGTLECSNKHTFRITQDIVRLDKENSDEQMKFLDHELTGYPKEVSEEDRLSFLEALENSLQNLQLSSKPLLVFGNPILFFRFVKSFENSFLVMDENEGTLRQVQNQVVQHQMFQNSGFVRSSDLSTENMQKISFLSETSPQMNTGDLVFSLVKEVPSDSNIIWESDDYNLIQYTIS